MSASATSGTPGDPKGSTPVTVGSADDPKGLAAGITISPRLASGGLITSVFRIVVTVAHRIGLGEQAGLATQLMRKVCDGPWVPVRSFSLSQSSVDLEDVVQEIDHQCAVLGPTVQYQVRISTAKGLVADSKAGSGANRIDLSVIDANSIAGGNQGFSFIGVGTAFGNVAGQLRVVEEVGNWFVKGDTNATALPIWSSASATAPSTSTRVM